MLLFLLIIVKLYYLCIQRLTLLVRYLNCGIYDKIWNKNKL